ncbi:calcium-responsive transcription factor-like [Palaemon carinicauda]|uniref:calcium-responsive transcription factor-like n=1 Tax=Palaemon carinicauda TaxID=392227 RepID=UPI0035B5D11A
MKKIKLEAVANPRLKEDIEDVNDVDFGMASKIIIEIVDPMTNPIIPMNLVVRNAEIPDPPWVKLFLIKFDNYNGIVESLNDVQEVVSCLEETTRTRFSVIKTRRKSFGCTEFNPYGIKVYWGEDGIPYTILNKKLMDCQHGKYRRPLPKGEKKVGRPTLMPDGVLKYKGTKKLNCPAQIRLREILRFPDFKVCENTPWRHKVQSKALKKAFQSRDVMTFHRCFVVSLPKIEQHENHLIEPADKPFTPGIKRKRTGRAHEPVHPKIIQKIRDLTIDGVFGTKNIKEQVMEYAVDELSQEEGFSFESRRFNPRDQDIRNVVRKVQTDLRKAGSSLAEVHCSSILKDLGNIVTATGDEKYLEQLKTHLEYLRSAVKLKVSLEPLNACYLKLSETEGSPGIKKEKNTGTGTEEEEVISYTAYAISDADNDNQILYEDDFPVKEESAHTVYYYE